MAEQTADHEPGSNPHTSEEERRSRRREAAIIIAAAVAVFAFAFWEIRRPGAHDGAAGNVFSFLLVNLNIVLVLLMIFLVVRNGMKVVAERRHRVPGSQLKSRMVLAFLTIALFPALVMLTISLEFSTNAIDDWFNTEVEESLRDAWHLAQTYYRDAGERAELHAAALAERLSAGEFDAQTDGAALRRKLDAYRRTYALAAVQVVSLVGDRLAATKSDPSMPDSGAVALRELLLDVGQGRISTRVVAANDGDLLRAAAPIRNGDAIAAAVVIDYLVERSARMWSEDIVNAFREYRRLELNKRPFQNLYVLTMVLASLVVVFSAIWLGLYLARGITEPLAKLAGATRRVAEGDWDVRLREVGGDEVGMLVRAFNAMTADLKATHATLEERRRYIENIVSNIDAGVAAVDANSFVATVNPAAISLLGLRGDEVVGRDAHAVFEEAGYPEVARLLEELERGAVVSGTRRNVEREAEGRTLLVIATLLESPLGGPTGFVLFFQDVSQLAGIQRMEAWREVARRIAHEIKNPLTPIQLSAQRLYRRLGPRLHGEDAEVFNDCTNTIVKEVEELKNLVNEFSQFARQPIAIKRPQDLNQLVEETLPLFRQAHPNLCITFEPAPDLPPVLMNREGVKRALVNLLSNAVAAVGATGDGVREGGDVVVRTSMEAELERVCLEVCDSGPGIPPEIRARVFEPYFSTKPDGTGLGLAIVSSIAADHQAYVRLHEQLPRGTRVVIEFPAGASADAAGSL